jgi:hypothetical protein
MSSRKERESAAPPQALACNTMPFTPFISWLFLVLCVAPGIAQSYTQLSSGLCDTLAGGSVTTLTECATAAVELGLSVTSPGAQNSPAFPEGCWFDDFFTALYLNSNSPSSTAECDSVPGVTSTWARPAFTTVAHGAFTTAAA